MEALALGLIVTAFGVALVAAGEIRRTARLSGDFQPEFIFARAATVRRRRSPARLAGWLATSAGLALIALGAVG